MSLPFQPELITVQQDRYNAAVAETIDRYKNSEYRIVQQRKHVFDSPDGIRLIVSREVNDLGEFIHFSASFDEYSRLFHEIRLQHVSKEAVLRMIIARFRDISRDYRRAKFEGFSPEKEVPHWSIRLSGFAPLDSEERANLREGSWVEPEKHDQEEET